MKTAIITFHFVNNFGGVLQAYAMQQTVRQYCGCEAQIIDYRNGFITLTDAIRVLPLSSQPKEIATGIRTLPDRFGRLGKFERFRKEEMRLTPLRYSHARLKREVPDADAYICGSDQIWNPVLTFGVDESYYLDFVGDESKKVAFAPSFGNARMPKVFQKKTQRLLQNLDAISVREKTGEETVFNLTNRPAELLIDPTFLLDKAHWEHMALESQVRQPYILLYIMQSDRTMYEYVRALKQRLGLCVVEISRYGFNPGFVDETLVDVGPREFLSLFCHADYICTNSYHGLIFSLIFEKQFCLVPCKRFQDRINHLVEMLSVKIEAGDIEQAGNANYDFKTVRERIRVERERSICWLRNQLRQEERGRGARYAYHGK